MVCQLKKVENYLSNCCMLFDYVFSEHSLYCPLGSFQFLTISLQTWTESEFITTLTNLRYDLKKSQIH